MIGDAIGCLLLFNLFVVYLAIEKTITDKNSAVK